MKKSALTATLLALCLVEATYGAEFFCPSADVSCLIAAINSANQNNEENTINLAPGTYSLTSIDNRAPDPNGIPVITGVAIINGESAETTIIERDSDAPGFRIFEVAATGKLTLNGLTIRNGVATPVGFRGGGIVNQGILEISRSVVRDNVAFIAGGIYNLGSAKIISSSVIHNAAGAEWAGGIANVTEFQQDDATMTIQNSTISDNIAMEGGGVRNTGNMIIVNSTIARNVAGGFGGGSGILNDRMLTITNSTVSANVVRTRPPTGVGRSAAITNDGTLKLENTIVALNLLLNSEETGFDCRGLITSLGNNIIGDPNGCEISLLSSDLTGDPGLGDFVEGDTPGGGHFPLSASSQAVDRGNAAACPETDQLGFPRLRACDIGSVEFQGRRILLSVRRDVIRAGRSIVARWRGIPAPASTDWIGLYLPGAENEAFIDWIYVSCSKTPGDPRRRGSCAFPVPASLVPGIYELRLLSNDGFAQLATSDSFTVTQQRRNLALGSP